MIPDKYANIVEDWKAIIVFLLCTFTHPIEGDITGLATDTEDVGTA